MTSTTIGAAPAAIAARPPHRFLTLSEPGRAMAEFASFLALRPAMGMGALPKGDGHGVLVLPGFMASDSSTRPMRSLLKRLGYDVVGWNLGRNIKVDNARVEAMARCVEELHDRTGGKISIVGWSLGGVFARELAKMLPEKVRMVISLGSPISDDRDHSNARRLFEYLNGKEPEPLKEGKFTGLDEAPPVPTTSVLTKGDGVVHWRGSVQHPHPDTEGQTENIEVIASHIGLGVNPTVMVAIADRLAQPEGEWRPFQAKGFSALMFPKTRLH
ncbi:alpha/beta fold hydrolase [Pontixanthobacter aestiaquae]|uniref:Alpha/beta fold hydrolase n=1 Tax=Pontixanthobacter aestiaquae TaxID=1509367 RepID=A0A844Z5C7_9SPHN|nr:alpha/beta fold hydrolase [Pontixanthobacter aestiaquae]MDN3645881.1 alpha/beta fold hydrolase [Pontixanthobacter aestiaquae]MXO83125.1 alpha/beta fold hydrolase [Pontixanthobacter aestiaquae]